MRTAGDGFAALPERRSLPDVIITDLSMPNVSGFELLSVVRRRFRQIPEIAISGEYNSPAPTRPSLGRFLQEGRLFAGTTVRKNRGVVEYNTAAAF